MPTQNNHALTQGEEGAAPSQYLTFIMNNEEYGVSILCVQEIRGWEPTTPLPNAPPHIKGVINLRGNIVPIIDLRQCFGLPAIQQSAVTVVIVLKVSEQNSSRIMGIMVDAVSDVYTLSRGDVTSPPDLGRGVDTQFIEGLVTVEDKMVILLDLNKLLMPSGVSDGLSNSLAGNPLGVSDFE